MTPIVTNPAPVSPTLRALLLAIALLAVLVPAWIVTHTPHMTPVHHRAPALPARHVVPRAEVPEVEPVQFADLPPEDARAFNATIPFSDGPNPPARPFALTGTPDDRARATDCMAAAVLYEAGDDTLGQRAVAQVVINRVRHPAFPKTICGVVFQGSERSTGCQFTFTCDGALASHHWSDGAWRRARETAALALTGMVFKPVGYATHYHTDWVVPYWQSSLDKVTEVHTHLFFRWTGWWGTPAAFNRHVTPQEPVIAQLALLSEAHRLGAVVDPADAALLDAAGLVAAQPLPQRPGDDNFLVTLNPKASPDSFMALARQACGARTYCKFMGWTNKARTPAALPLQPRQIAAMTFSYLRDTSRDYDKALWNCAEFKRADSTQCMKMQVFVPAGADDAPVVAAPTAADGLTGVRHKGDPAPKPSPTPKPVSTPTPGDRHIPPSS